LIVLPRTKCARRTRAIVSTPFILPPPILLAGWAICTNEVHDEPREGIRGKMYSQPRERCDCGARVLELYTCRIAARPMPGLIATMLTSRPHFGPSPDKGFAWRGEQPARFCLSICSLNNRLWRIPPTGPADPAIAEFGNTAGEVQVIVENQLIVRRNLPAATRNVLQRLGS
jgi:hypothetical protein